MTTVVNSSAPSSTYLANSALSLGFTGTAGNTILIGVFENGTDTITGVTDNAGNVYTLDVTSPLSGNGRRLFRASGIAGAPTTFTVACPSTPGLYFCAIEVNGLSNASPLDATVAQTTNSTTASFTTTVANDLAFFPTAASGGSVSAGAPGYTVVSGFLTAVYNANIGSAGAQTLTLTSSAGSNYILGAAYKAASAAPTYSLGDVTVDHAAGTVTVPVTLSAAAPAGGFSVNLQTADGTATSPAYYTAKSGSVSIPAGQTSGTFVVAINP